MAQLYSGIDSIKIPKTTTADIIDLPLVDENYFHSQGKMRKDFLDLV